MTLNGRNVTLAEINKKAVLSQGEPCDVAVKFDGYRILERHRAISLPQHGFLVFIA